METPLRVRPPWEWRERGKKRKGFELVVACVSVRMVREGLRRCSMDLMLLVFWGCFVVLFDPLTLRRKSERESASGVGASSTLSLYWLSYLFSFLFLFLFFFFFFFVLW